MYPQGVGVSVRFEQPCLQIADLSWSCHNKFMGNMQGSKALFLPTCAGGLMETRYVFNLLSALLNLIK